FIHGKGNGSLKLELRKCLDRNYKRCQYQDASFEEYGGGATLVYVK
ncbi:MAG: Smr/MutS family protein, partial [Bacteroidales bacterium]|nr:Smr/MutS family protein [Bacteroidales bacterium]